MAGEETQKLEFSNFEPVLRSLGGHLNWFLHEYNTLSLLNLKKHYLDSPEIKVKIFRRLILPNSRFLKFTNFNHIKIF
jgi:hypothetical protein